MKWDDILAGSIAGLAIAVVVAVLVVLAPLFYALGGFITGAVLAYVFPFAGRWVMSGAGVLGIELARESLPMVGAFLGFVGAFFKARQTNKKEKD